MTLLNGNVLGSMPGSAGTVFGMGSSSCWTFTGYCALMRTAA